MQRIVLQLTVLAFWAAVLPGFARDFAPSECPVVGNKETKIYHTPGGLKYRQMLQENQKAARENRVCFPNEEAAKNVGYRKSKS